MAATNASGREIVDMCRSLGFAGAGVCAAEPTDRAQELLDWLEAGRCGSMAYLREHVEQRTDPRCLLAGARSIIVVADQYAQRGGADDPEPPARFGRIARYARGRDYHREIKQRLHTLCDALCAQFPDEAFRAFTDTAPTLEREHAARAGLGWIAKHTLLIDPRLGSYLLLGGVVTTLDIEPPSEQETVPDHCGTCTRCIDACPTDAITPYSVDASRCISYLTIERRGAIDPAFHAPIGEWLFGCDICQEVCPHNSARPGGADVGAVNPAYAPRRAGFDALEVLGWTQDDRRAAFTTSAMKRATLAMMRRNAVIVAGNRLRRQGDAALRARLEAIAQDEHEDDMVRETAVAVLGACH